MATYMKAHQDYCNRCDQIHYGLGGKCVMDSQDIEKDLKTQWVTMQAQLQSLQKEVERLREGLQKIGIYASGKPFHKTVFKMVADLLKEGSDGLNRRCQ